MKEADVISKLLLQLKTELDGTQFELINETEDISSRWSGFCIENTKWKNFIIKFEFNLASYKDVYYGIISKDETENKLNKVAIDEIHNLPNGRHTNLWHYWMWVDDRFRNWDDDMFTMLENDNSLIIDYIINVLYYCDRVTSNIKNM